MTYRVTSGFLIAAIATLLTQTAGASAPRRQDSRGATPTRPAVHEGQSATLLPDGRWLLIGGLRDGRPTSAVELWDPHTLQTSPAPDLPDSPRADHTATLLPTGEVLILGGVGSAGEIAGALRFHPVSSRFDNTTIPFDARTAHSTTLLTDGRVLIAGGRGSDGRLVQDALIWDPGSPQRADVAYMIEPRQRHTATLLEDGSVLIEGGVGPGGRSNTAELFFPENSAFVSATAARGVREGSRLSGSLPMNGAADVPVDTGVALRFSVPLNVRSVTSATLTIAGPDGHRASAIVPAEHGRLLFLKPDAPLLANTTYTVAAGPFEDQNGRPVPPASIVFTTADAEVSAQTDPDDEQWAPDANARRNGWRSNRPDSRWRALPPLQAPPGVTAMAGQVLLLNGNPLANATLELGGRRTTTDDTGRFLLLLPGVPAGHHVLVADGSTANSPGRMFGVFEIGLPVGAGRTNVLPFTIWMTRLDTAHAVSIPSPTPGPVVIRTPLIPGLELHLAPNTVIRDRNRNIVRQLSITPIPVDRPPFPLPNRAEVPIYFTIQPGGAYVHVYGQTGIKGARLVYPNYTNQPPNTVTDFWHYNPKGEGWHVYGKGAVTPNGRQVVPDPGVSIYQFTGAMISTSGSWPSIWPAAGGGPAGGDPVDLATGLFVYDKMDLALPDVLPIAVARTYRPGDTESREFGRGARHPYDIDLWRPNFTYETADLILPDGARVHYVCSNPGAGNISEFRFESTSTPTAFYKSRFQWNGQGWDLTLRDGTVYVFGDNAPLQSIRDRFGNTLQLERSPGQSGYIRKIISPNNRWVTFTYDSGGRITEARDNLGRTVGYTYDASLRLWKVTDVAGGVTEYTYDASHRMLTVKDPRGITYLTNQYDSNGRVESQTLADTGVFQFDYTLDGSGKVTQTDMTDPEGRIQRVTFNADGYALTDTEAYGTALARTTTFTRAAGSNFVTAVEDPLLRDTTYAYDTFGNLTTVTHPAGTGSAQTTTYTYEPAYHQLATVTDPLNHTTSYAYDHLGRLSAITDALSRETSFTYNSAGQPLTVTDPLSKTTTFTYDRGSLAAVTSPLGNTETRFVDGAGRLLQLTNAMGATTRFEYTAFDQPSRIVDPLGAATTFTYDPNGNLLTLTDARTKTTTWTYDSMDRVATRTDPLSRTDTYVYDLSGGLTSWTDRKGQVTTYQYDALGRQTFTGFGTTGAPPTYASTVSRTYDAGDRLTDIVDSAAGTIERTYDLLDRLTEEITPEGTVTYTHDAAGRRATMTVAGQTAISYTFDNADRLTDVTRGAAAVAIAYDNADRRTSLTLPNGIVVEYGFDDDSRLTGLTYKLGGSTLGTLTYGYDANGQRTSVGGTYARIGLPAALASATYDDANQIATFGGTSFTYDNNGNLTSDGVRAYTWNARDELASLTGPANGSFAYDGFGRRRSKTVSGTTTQFLYDGLNPVQELSGGTPTANLVTGLGIDEFYTRTDGAGVRNYLTDALGSSVALADGTGAVLTDYTYEPFGGTATSGTSTASAFQFTGREADGTGLHFYRARYYDARLQRFIGEDPLGFGAGDINLHAYVSNRPVTHTDPTGEFAVPLILCAAGGGGSALADWLSGRKFDPIKAAGHCAVGLGLGFAGPALAAAAGYGGGGAAAGYGGAAAAAAGGAAIGRWAGAAADAFRAAVRTSMTRTYTDGARDYTYHAAKQALERGISPERIDQVMSQGTRVPGNTAAETVLNLTAGGRATRVVIDTLTGRVVTVIDRGRK